MARLGHKPLDQTMRYVHAEDAHWRPIPQEIRAVGETDPTQAGAKRAQ